MPFGLIGISYGEIGDHAIEMLASLTVSLLRNYPLHKARNTLVEESTGCEDDQAMFQGA
jgi:hypothetical protein